MDLKNRYTAEEIYNKKDSIKKIFFYKICGTGMGAGATLLKSVGKNVEGGDHAFNPPMGPYLESLKIPLFDLNDFDFSHLKKFDLVVIGNALWGKSEEARDIENVGVPFASLPDTLSGLVLDDLNVIGISGTHGKTTTTYFLKQMFDNLGVNPGYMLGGALEGHEKIASYGDGHYFVIEADEYDCAYFQKEAKLRNYSIDHLILTSLEFDHADIYQSIDDIKKEFKELLKKLNHTFVLDENYEASRELWEEYEHQFKDGHKFLYGKDSEVGPYDITSKDNIWSFKLKIHGNEYSFSTNVYGHHNILNISACILLLFSLDYSIEEINESIKNLKMVKRRQEYKGKINQSLFIDDFAHHPSAVEVTLEAIKSKYPDHSVTVILEPMSASSRSNLFQKEYEKVLSKAQEVVILRPVKDNQIKNYKNLDVDKICSLLTKNHQVEAKVVDHLEELTQVVEDKTQKHSNNKNVICFMSNYTCMGFWNSEYFLKNVKK